jgi:hypothetical protein
MLKAPIFWAGSSLGLVQVHMIFFHGGFRCYAWLLEGTAFRIFFQLGIATPPSCGEIYLFFFWATLPMLETT